MRKTLLKSSAAFFVVLALALVGCSQPTEFTNTNKDVIPSLAGPAGLEADITQKGGVILTWDPNINAQEYEVWRAEWAVVAPATTATRGPFVSLKKNVGGTYYQDIISDGNQLKNDTKYTYKVVAVSSHSTARTVNDILQNGETDLEVTTAADQFPAKGDATLVTAPAAVTVTVDSLGVLKATWPVSANPFVSYKVARAINASTFTEDGSYTPYGSYTYNEITGKGTARIAVTAQIAGGYYASPEAVIGTADYDIAALPAEPSTPSIGSFSADRISLSGSYTEQVIITYTEVPGYTYELKKIVLTDTTVVAISSPVSSIPEALWVDGPAATLTTVSGARTMVATDTVPLDQAVIYRLIAKNGNQSSSAVYKKIDVQGLETTILLGFSSPSVIPVIPSTPAITTLDYTQYKLRFEFIGEPGASYTFYRQLTADGYGNTIGIQPWKEISGAVKAGADNKVVYVYTVPYERAQYSYTVVGTKDGKIANITASAVTPITAPALSVSDVTSLVNVPNAASPYYLITFNNALLPGESVTVFGKYGNSNSTVENPSEQLGVFSGEKPTVPTNGSVSYYFTGKSSTTPSTWTGKVNDFVIRGPAN
jgi:hypothetical protein